MPRPQMPKTPSNSPTFTQAQKQNVQQARSDANAARPTTNRIEKLLRQQPSPPKP